MRKRNVLKSEELSVACEQLAMILRAGLPLGDGVEALSENYRGTRFEAGFMRLSEKLLQSAGLHDALQEADIFPDYMVKMTRIGERTGELENVMQELGAHYEREAHTRRAIQNAVLYPLLLIAMMAVLIAVLILQVFPMFEEVFRGLGLNAQGSPFTTAAMGFGKVVLLAAGVFVLVVMALLLCLKLDRSGSVRRLLMRVLSPMGRLQSNINAERFAATLSMTFKSGYPLDESLEMAEELFDEVGAQQQVRACRERMEQGVPFHEAVEQTGMFSALHCRMIGVGFRAGQADRVMSKLAEEYRQETEEQLARLISIIEPALVALMSVIIGGILLSVMLPLLSIFGVMA